MKHRVQFLHFLILLVCLSVAHAFAQMPPATALVAHQSDLHAEKARKYGVPLKEALLELEQRFHAGFLYYSDVAERKTTRIRAGSFQNLETALARVLAPLELISVKVGNNSYVIAEASQREEVLKTFGAVPQETGKIAGSVKDAEGNALIGANVSIKGTAQGAATDRDGNFIIENVMPGNYSLVVSFIGYRRQEVSVSVSAGETASIDVALEPDILMMDQIVATATRAERAQKEATVSMAVITEQRIRDLAPQSVAEVLRTVPGIHAEEGGGEVAVNSFVRGLPAPGQFRYQTLQEDGMPIRSIPGGFISAEDVFFRQDLNVQTLEVAKGGSSTLFGINAPGGIINYRSKTGGEVLRSTLQFTSADKNLYRVDFNTNGPLGGNYRFNLGGFYRYDEGPRVSGLPTQGLQLKGNITRLTDTGYLRLYAKYIDDQVQFLLPFAHNSQTLEPAIPSDGTHNSAEAADFTIPTPGGLFESTMERGVMTKGATVMLEYANHFGEGWALENKVKWMDMEHEFNIFIPFVAQLPNAYASGFMRDENDQAIYSYTNDPRPFNSQALMRQGVWARFRPTNEIADQIILKKEAHSGTSTHLLSLGAYLSRTQALDKQIRTVALFELADQPRLVDLAIAHADGDTTQVTRNGISEVSNNYFNRRFQSNTVAIFAGDEMKLGDRLRIDIGARYERQTAVVRVERTSRFNLGPTLAEQNAVFGNGSFVRRTVSFDDFGIAAGLNYAVSDQLNFYATGSRGFVFPELSTFAGNVSLDAQGNFVQPEPEKNEEFLQAETGLRIASPQFSGTVSGYWVQIRNRLQGDIRIIDGRAVQITDAVGKSRTIGLEATGAFAPPSIPGLRLEASLTLQKHKATDFKIGDNDLSGNKIKRIPDLMVNGSVVYQHRGLDFLFNWSHLGPRFADDANLFELDAFDVFTLSAGYSIPITGGQSLRLGINIYNLFDSKGLTEGDPRLATGVDPTQFPFLNARPVLPQRFKFSATYTF